VKMCQTLQDIVLTMFQDAHTDACTDGRTGQNHYISSHTTLGGGMKMIKGALEDQH